MKDRDSPLKSLENGNWFKLICGASYQHLPDIRNLALVYTLAGADCIDVAADPATIAAAQEGIKIALELREKAPKELRDRYHNKPLLMVSLNDGEDPHFRKAQFNPEICPSDCWRPCEKVCPAIAIVFSDHNNFSGVIDQRCYGCGRCIPICPSQIIYTRSYVSTPNTIAPLVQEAKIDAIEIHTQIGRETDFKRLWDSIAPWRNQLKLLGISCADGENLIDYLQTLYQIISPLNFTLVWQTDGRPMSGDIGIGTTHPAIKLGEKVLAAKLPGYVQLAGGTNNHTVSKLRSLGLLHPQQTPTIKPLSPLSPERDRTIAGVAYGSYARVLLSPILQELENLQTQHPKLIAPDVTPQLQTITPNPHLTHLENLPDLLWQAVSLAHSLVSQIK